MDPFTPVVVTTNAATAIVPRMVQATAQAAVAHPYVALAVGLSLGTVGVVTYGELLAETPAKTVRLFRSTRRLLHKWTAEPVITVNKAAPLAAAAE